MLAKQDFESYYEHIHVEMQKAITYAINEMRKTIRCVFFNLFFMHIHTIRCFVF